MSALKVLVVFVQRRQLELSNQFSVGDVPVNQVALVIAGHECRSVTDGTRRCKLAIRVRAARGPDYHRPATRA